MRKRGLCRGWLPFAGALLLLEPAVARAAPSLSHAEALYEIHDSAGAERELRALLAHELPRRLAAAAHLYLGLVELEARADTAAAEAELARALKLDARVAMPFSASAEELQLYDHVRQELRTIGAPPEPGSPVPGQAATEPAPAAAVTEAPPASGHGAWPWVLGVGAIAAASASVWGFLQVGSENSAAAKSHSQPVPLAQAQSALSQGQLGEGVGIAGAVVAVGLGVGAVLTW